MSYQSNGNDSDKKDRAKMQSDFADRLSKLVADSGENAKFIKKINEIRKRQAKGDLDAKTLKDWKNPDNGISIDNVYLIAIAGEVSVDWLLGLSGKKFRSWNSFKLLYTYGDVLTILNDLSEKDVMGITTADSLYWYSDGLPLPKYIQVKDKHLIELIDELYVKGPQELDAEKMEDVWEKTLEFEMKKPLQEYGGKQNDDGEKSEQINYEKLAASENLLDTKALKGQIIKQLEKLKGDLTYEKFGEKIGIARSTVSGWFTKHTPKPYHLYKISKAYECKVDSILGLDKAVRTVIPREDEVYTYGRVLLILKHLIENGTLDFVEKYFSPFHDSDDYNDNERAYVMNDLFVIGDWFLFYLLMQSKILGQYSTVAFKEMNEELYNKYKDTPLLSFNKSTRYDLYEIVRDLSQDGIGLDIDLDNLYKKICRD